MEIRIHPNMSKTFISLFLANTHTGLKFSSIFFHDPSKMGLLPRHQELTPRAFLFLILITILSSLTSLVPTTAPYSLYKMQQLRSYSLATFQIISPLLESIHSSLSSSQQQEVEVSVLGFKILYNTALFSSNSLFYTLSISALPPTSALTLYLPLHSCLSWNSFHAYT